MTSCMPVLIYIARANASGAMAGASASVKWHLIDWQKATLIVRSLQSRIVKAVKAGKWKNLRDLQRLLSRSTSAKVLAIRRVTENKGKRTAGIDGVKWSMPKQKYEAIAGLNHRGYKAQPTRRVMIPKTNGKMRPLGIPTMRDRAMQALHLMGLDPVSESLADFGSYGFRRYRSCADAIKQCHTILSRRKGPQYVLEADIKSCFSEISHQWLLGNIPMNKRVLKQWLKAGYLDKQGLFPTQSGTPQGSIISPCLANMVLDGMENAIDKALDIRRARNKEQNDNPHRVHLIRYADDFVITANDKKVLENQVRPVIEAFLADRGLRLSEEKTVISKVAKGFDFLGKNIRKYKGNLIIKPSKKNVKTFLDKIRTAVKAYQAVETIALVRKLNPMIRGWTMYHRMDNAADTFSYVDHRIWQMIWRWAIRRHRNKNKQWIKDRYFKRHRGVDWTLFAIDEDGDQLTLMRASKVAIKRHIPVKGKANPYDPKWEWYYEKRSDLIMLDKLQGRRILRYLYDRQKGICSHCHQRITSQTGWNVHHIIPKYLGGTDIMDNLVMLHPVCHQQLHHQNLGYDCCVDQSVQSA